jgi:predicted Zn-dependent protease
MITKNNPYYLDTLAQLYYKDGQKDKAIETQKKALQYSSTVYEEQTLNDMKEVLDKMQNGTY